MEDRVLEICRRDEVRRVEVYSVKSWLSVLEYYERSEWKERRVLFELALRRVPRSYKIWLLYLRESERRCDEHWLSGKGKTVKGLYERCLVQLPRYPRIWLGYCQTLWHLRDIKQCRNAFDRALRTLPLNQHGYIWPDYTSFATECGEPYGSMILARRCIFERSFRSEFAEYLEKKAKKIGGAALVLVDIVDDSEEEVTHSIKHKAWLKLCDLCCQYPHKVKRIDVDAVIRGGLQRYKYESAVLWCKLADFYIRSGSFEMARDVYEEAVNSVMTVKDFGITFDAYAKFEEALISAQISDEEDEEARNDLDLRLARLEDLVKRRPLLLSAVILRQNPHNVSEWLKRAKHYQEIGEDVKAVETFSDAVKTIDPDQVVAGRPHTVWLAFADFYIQKNRFESDARLILRRASQEQFRTVDDLAAVFCFWIEAELRFEHYEASLQVAQDAVLRPLTEGHAIFRTINKKRKKYTEEEEDQRDHVVDMKKHTLGSVQARLARHSTKVWALYLDLEESIGGNLTATRAAYDKALELKVASPQIIINYARLLIEKSYYEDGFRVYERGIALLEPGFVFQVWISYARDLMARFETSKKERIRDLFERCLTKVEAAPSESKAPGHVQPDQAAVLYLEYAAFEERHQQLRRAMSLYDRAARYATERASDDQVSALDAWLLYAKKVEINYGATKARLVYEEAIKVLKSPDEAREACLIFAKLEIALVEIDRARAVYAHGAQFAHPQLQTQYWDHWRNFEVAHGNEDTFREMLRIKRSVQTALDLNVTHFLAATNKSEAPPPHTSIQQLEEEAATAHVNDKILPVAPTHQPRPDPNEISLDLIDDDDDDQDDHSPPLITQVEQRPVPAAVFGTVGQELLDAVQASPSSKPPELARPLGALARFRQQQQQQQEQHQAGAS